MLQVGCRTFLRIPFPSSPVLPAGTTPVFSNALRALIIKSIPENASVVSSWRQNTRKRFHFQKKKT